MYVCQDTTWNGSKNKFWGFERITDTEIKVVWGRIGTKGQNKVHHFNSSYRADDFIDKKTREKVNKGYKKISDGMYNILHAQAAALGSRHKLFDQKWVEIIERAGDSVKFNAVDDTRLSDPDITPALSVKAEIKDKESVKHYNLLITNDEILHMNGGIAKTMTTDDPGLRKIMSALKEGIACGSHLSAT